MIPYHDRDHDSGVAAYESSADLIRVQFRDGSIYRYTAASAGSANIATMQHLAAAGDGLNAFINRHVRDLYAR